jgi:hypothetical protein
MRRVKSIGITIPCVTGSYTGVNAKLALGGNRIRTNGALVNGSYPPLGDNNSIQNVGGVEAIATSSAQSDAGLFELNFRDERFLPFEGAGAISTWTFSMSRQRNFFDLNTVTDIVFHLRYTARDGGDLLGGAAATALDATPPSLSCLLSARDDFADAWEQFWDPAATDAQQTFTIALDQDLFRAPPFKSVNGHLVAKVSQVTAVSFIWKFKDRPLSGQAISAATEYRTDAIALKLTVPGGNGSAPLVETPRFGNLPALSSTFGQPNVGVPLPLPLTVTAADGDIGALDPNNHIPLSVPQTDANNVTHHRLNRDAVEDLIIVVDYTEA